MQRFLGLENYHRTFIKDFADLAQPVYCLTGKNKVEFWKTEEDAFQAHRKALTEPPVLGLNSNTDPFILDKDASDVAIAVELLKLQNMEDKVDAFISFA